MPLFYCVNNIQGTLNMLEIARQNGVKKFVNADISKAKRLLGYAPDYDFAKGLTEAIEWYKKNL